jgi:hypothetical protein
MIVDEKEIAALRREGEAYAAAGMVYRARLVNEQLALRGADPVAIPDDKPQRQVRTSTQAATRKKRSAD